MQNPNHLRYNESGATSAEEVSLPPKPRSAERRKHVTRPRPNTTATRSPTKPTLCMASIDATRQSSTSKYYMSRMRFGQSEAAAAALTLARPRATSTERESNHARENRVEDQLHVSDS